MPDPIVHDYGFGAHGQGDAVHPRVPVPPPTEGDRATLERMRGGLVYGTHRPLARAVLYLLDQVDELRAHVADVASMTASGLQAVSEGHAEAADDIARNLYNVSRSVEGLPTLPAHHGDLDSGTPNPSLSGEPCIPLAVHTAEDGTRWEETGEVRVVQPGEWYLFGQSPLPTERTSPFPSDYPHPILRPASPPAPAPAPGGEPRVATEFEDALARVNDALASTAPHLQAKVEAFVASLPGGEPEEREAPQIVDMLAACQHPGYVRADEAKQTALLIADERNEARDECSRLRALLGEARTERDREREAHQALREELTETALRWRDRPETENIGECLQRILALREFTDGK